MGAAVAAIRSKLPASKVLLLGIFPRANRADHPLRGAANTTNTLIASLGDGRPYSTGIGFKFLGRDGTLSGEIMPDYLRPNAKGIRYGLTPSKLKWTAWRASRAKSEKGDRMPPQPTGH